MGKLYDPDANDPYQDVALIFAGFQCDNCGDYCAGNPDGSSDNPLGGSDSLELDCVTMARVARDLGWIVILATKPDEFRVRCPSCC
ncbi:hypothetical protein [Neorhodopirellula lusitana]|uniref:hypothetical protein n=1 Tax=Neorhodopirellula lusitana TaxID=445327 RepID=UPI00384E94C3